MAKPDVFNPADRASMPNVREMTAYVVDSDHITFKMNNEHAPCEVTIKLPGLRGMCRRAANNASRESVAGPLTVKAR